VTVIPNTGHYTVITQDPDGRVRLHLVGKDKRCSCGGSPERRCGHIEAVAAYLRAGGKRAPVGSEVHRSGPTPTLACPICGEAAEPRGSIWRCSASAAHYWQWRGERNGGAIHRFLTQAHPAKQGAFYEQTAEEREAFLEQVTRQMHAGGYTPFQEGPAGGEE
jgi:hypothetical protein